MDDHGGVVDAVPVADGRADHQDRQQLGGGRDDVRDGPVDVVEQQVLQDDVFNGVTGQRQLRENGQRYAVVVALPGHPQDRLGVRRGVTDDGVMRARGDAGKALAVSVVKSIALPLSPRGVNSSPPGIPNAMSDTAVLVVDMMNTYQHPDADDLIPNVEKIIEPLTDLVRRARTSDEVDLIYVNDNYGDFTAEFSGIVRSALDGARPDLVKPIAPAEGSRLMTKVRHSAFYSTALAYLLSRLDTKRLIITGQVTEQCILYTALDAYVRHFPVVIPTDAVAHIDADLGAAACKMMEQNMSAELTTAADCLDPA